MATQLSIPKENLPGVAQIAEHHKTLHLIEEAAKEIDADKRTPSAVTKAYGIKAKLPAAVARRIVTQILAFHHLEDRLSLTPEELFESLSESIEGDPDASAAIDPNKWATASMNIINVLNKDSTLHIVEKNVRLAYDHPNPIRETKIITDLRPIFDEKGLNIKQMTITHTLHIEYHDGVRLQTLFLTLDAADVTKLRKFCERAEIKAVTIKKQMHGLAWPVAILGEYPDE